MSLCGMSIALISHVGMHALACIYDMQVLHSSREQTTNAVCKRGQNIPLRMQMQRWGARVSTAPVAAARAREYSLHPHWRSGR